MDPARLHLDRISSLPLSEQKEILALLEKLEVVERREKARKGFQW